MKSISKKENKIKKICVKCHQNFTPIENHHEECLYCFLNLKKSPFEWKCMIDLDNL